MIKYYRIIFLLVIILHQSSFGQVTRIRGTITDQTTGEPLPFVNISVKGLPNGTITNINGTYFLELRTFCDTLTASYIGYKPAVIKITNGIFQQVNIQLEPQTVELNEVVVLPGKNPAHRLLDSIASNKWRNSPTRQKLFSYEVYNKIEIDINNITNEYKNQKVFKQFKFIFDYIDTSAITGKSFLPVFITETLSDYYYQNNPKRQKEIIKASKISGIDDNVISEFTGKMYLDFNFYDNFIPIMGVNMVSPVANIGKMYYKYYLIDSAYRQNNWCYQISFKPKRRQEPVFTGYFWVSATTWAIENYKIQMDNNVNINFVKSFVAEQWYSLVNDSVWFPKKQELFIDFAITNNDYGFFGRNTTSYNNIIINPGLPESFFSPNMAEETITLDSATNISPNQWQNLRHEQLTQREDKIYQMVDSIQEVPLYNNIINFINTLLTGYWVKNKVEIGPYYTLYSFNPIEGHRVKLSMRTSNNFSTKYMFNAHLAYGTRDQKLKYGIGGTYMFKVSPRRCANAYYFYDNEQLGISDYAFLSDNILSTIFARKQNDKLTTVKEYGGYYEHEWFLGFSNKLKWRNKNIYASQTVPFTTTNITGDTVSVNIISTTELLLNTRFAYNEKFIMGKFERMSLGTHYPVFNLGFTFGHSTVLNNTFNYYKLNFSVEQNVPLSPFGNLRYVINAGKVFGDAPFPFHQLHEGNQTYAYDDYAFNLMNYYEFVSSQFATVILEHHFNGLFLNRVPLLRKLKWREVATTKILAGDFASRTSNNLFFPAGLNVLNKPYAETGVGIENVFRFFRIDAVWRLSYLDNPNALPFAVLAKMQFKF